MGRTGGNGSGGSDEGGSGGARKPKMATTPRLPSRANSKVCYCYGKPPHFARECLMKDKTYNVCKLAWQTCVIKGEAELQQVEVAVVEVWLLGQVEVYVTGTIKLECVLSSSTSMWEIQQHTCINAANMMTKNVEVGVQKMCKGLVGMVASG